MARAGVEDPVDGARGGRGGRWLLPLLLLPLLLRHPGARLGEEPLLLGVLPLLLGKILGGLLLPPLLLGGLLLLPLLRTGVRALLFDASAVPAVGHRCCHRCWRAEQAERAVKIDLVGVLQDLARPLQALDGGVAVGRLRHGRRSAAGRALVNAADAAQRLRLRSHFARAAR